MKSSLTVLATTLVIQSLASMCLMTLPVIAPAVAATVGISAAYVGAYIAIAYLGGIATSLLAGDAVRRLGAIRCSQLALFSGALGLMVSTAGSLPAMILGAALVGFGYGPITPASSHLLALSTPAHRMSFVFSIKQTGVPIGGVLAGLLVPNLEHLWNWQWAFMVVAASNILLLLVLQPFCKTLDADKNPAQKLAFGNGLLGPLKMVFSHTSLKVLAIVSFLLSFVQLSLTTYLATFLHEDLFMSLVLAGSVVAIAQMAGAAGRLIWGWLADRFLGSVNALICLSLLTLVFALATGFLYLSSSLVLILLVLSILGACAIGWNGVYLAEVARQAPGGQASIATGGTLAMTFSGNVLGPPLFGLVAVMSGSYSMAFACLMLPAAICVYLLQHHRAAFQVQ